MFRAWIINCLSPKWYLTPKIPCVFFLPNSVVSDIVGGIIFFINHCMGTWGSNHRIFNLPCWTSTSKSYNLSFHGIHEMLLFKHQILTYFGIFYSELLHSDIHENQMVFFLFGVFCKSFPNHVEHKWSKSNFRFVSMSEVEFFLSKGVFNINSNTIQNSSGYIEMISCKAMSTNKNCKKKWKPQILWANQTSFLAPYPSVLR